MRFTKLFYSFLTLLEMYASQCQSPINSILSESELLRPILKIVFLIISPDP